MSARYSTAQLRGQASNGIPHSIPSVIGKLSSELFRTANSKEPGMRNINNRDFRFATRTILGEINRKMMVNLIRERRPIFRVAETSLSVGTYTTVHPQAIRRLRSVFFIGGY
jgi:hypothetical protein